VRHFFGILLFAYIFISEINADDSVVDIAKDAHLANINAILIFSSHEGLSSGLYKFTNVGVDMEVYHLPFTYEIQSENSHVEYSLTGTLGYSRVFISENIELPPNFYLNYSNHIRTYLGGLGIGVKYKASDTLNISAGVEVIYSRSGASVSKIDDDINDAIEDFFNKEYNDNISYKFFTTATYRPKVNNFKPYATLSYKLYETKSTFTFEKLSTFRTESSVTTLTFGTLTDELLSYKNNYLTLEGYLNANYLSGAVKDTVKFNSFATLGSIAYWNFSEKPYSIEKLFLEISTIRADGLEGYNIGVGFSLGF